MSKFEFSLDFDDDDDCSSVATAGTQTTTKWLEELQRSERAATLSRKLQKYAQKRAARMSSVPWRPAVNNEGGAVPHTNSMSSSVTPLRSNGHNGSMFNSVSFEMSPERELAEQYEFEKAEQLTADFMNISLGAVEQTREQVRPAALLPSQELPLKQMTQPRGEDEEFYDASSDFSDDVLEKLSPSSSYHAEMVRSDISHNEADGPITDHYFAEDILGISAVRNMGMSQSLMKVEEQDEPNGYRGHTMSSRLAAEKPTRSSSVSPRPSPNVTFSDTPTKQNSESTTSSKNSSPSPIKAELHQDLQTVQDLARRQEEALRQAVLQQQQQLERKLSWHEAQSSSHSSVNSLASSKSADISTLQSTKTARSSSRLPRPSAIPQPTGRKTSAPASRGHSVVAEPRAFAANVAVDDDECF